MSKITLHPTTFEDVADLHIQVFNEQLKQDAIDEKLKKGPLKFLKVNSSELTVGFVIIQYRENTLHIWLMGVLQAFRGHGYGHEILHQLERIALDSNICRITLSSFNHRKEMMALAIKEGFKIVKTEKGRYDDKIKIRLDKIIYQKKEIRIIMTNRCNFNCFFCHSEGLDSKESYTESSAEEIVEYIKEAISIGYDDVTFTGGEPLLRKKDLLRVIYILSEMDVPPSITVVSNGLLLDAECINCFTNYTGLFKINLSLHSMDNSIFDQIVFGKKLEQRDGHKNSPFHIVKDNIRSATRRGVQVKLNCVLLAGLNDQNTRIREYLQKAADVLHVSSVKFLELMVLPGNKENYDYFIAAESIVDSLLELNYEKTGNDLRVQKMKSSDFPDLSVEVTSLTCRIGCANCSRVRDRTLGPNLDYYPCFIQSDQPILLDDPSNLAQAFRHGDDVIRGYAKKHGNDSPILIAQKIYVKSRVQAFFETSMTRDNLVETLLEQGFRIAKMKTFYISYCIPMHGGEKWEMGDKTLKIRRDEHTPNKAEFIFSYHKKRKFGEYIFWEQEFLTENKPPYSQGLNEAKKIMQALDFSLFPEIKFELEEFRKDQLSLTFTVSDRFDKRILMVESNSALATTLEHLLLSINAVNIDVCFDTWAMKQIDQN